MNTIILRNLAIFIAMLIAVGISFYLKPSSKLEHKASAISLDELIPKSFGDWKEDPIPMPMVSPDVKAALDKVYAQTLSRTYVNAEGERIMLSIAYGQDQSDSLAIHLPEGCYQGQGFAVGKKELHVLNTPYGDIPAAKLLATKGLRNEPITYWVIIGDKVVSTAWDMKKVKFEYTLRHEVPDGFLIRISNITSQTKDAYVLQEEFAKKMISSIAPDKRQLLIGSKDQ
ncbi:exosortase-associated protein EpsI, B-type [Methylobacillus sp.]|uniref:exosortase-associated protein EpsI, B-type n=1 Tax=Methylobacillus sp. TaxID=56818 RepID=UPI0012CC83CD|nr:exosortase-associated protein EpsI, B-type [Methylobacillus sp.]MPS48364.1 EpsI family protein [Methylobacillus sp.]